MSLKPLGAWHFTAGLVAGSTLAYLLAVVLGLLLPSWPFNAFFTPLAALSLALQVPYACAAQRQGQRWRLGTALALLWLCYCRGWPA